MCVCVCVCGVGFRRTWTMLVFISTNLRNFYSRFYVQQYIITDFLAEVPSGLPRTEFQELTYKVRRYELPQWYHNLLTNTCALHCVYQITHQLMLRHVSVSLHDHQGDQCHCQFFAIHQMIMAHHRLCLPDVLSASHEAVNRSLYISTHAHSPKQVRIKGNFICLFN